MGKAAAIDIDRLAREAVKPVDPEDELPELTPADVPCEVAYWGILVAPIRAQTKSAGGLLIAQASQKTEEYQITIGRVLKCGPAAFEGKTEGGIPLNRLCKGVETPEQLIGKYVIYQPYAGYEMKRRADKRVVKMITNTEILAITSDPYAWRFWI